MHLHVNTYKKHSVTAKVAPSDVRYKSNILEDLVLYRDDLYSYIIDSIKEDVLAEPKFEKLGVDAFHEGVGLPTPYS